MTQKELLYVEDAIGHEQNIIAIGEYSIELLEDEELKTFIENELEIHKETLNNLMNKLEVIANE